MISWALAYACVKTNDMDAMVFIVLTGIFDLIAIGIVFGAIYG